MEDQIKQIIKKTEKIILDSEINEDLRSTAFAEVFRFLLNNNGLNIKDNPQNPQVPNTSKIEVPNLKIKSNSSGLGKSSKPAALIDNLIESGFFKEKRRDVDCQNELKISKGITIPRKQMATTLVRKLRSGKLKRESTKAGYVYFV